MRFSDAITLDGGLRETADGYRVGDARVSRANNIQIYAGREVGRPDLSMVRVFRPEAEVFADRAMASAAYRPITVDHPPESVAAQNWKKYSRGQSGGEISRDGDFLRVPLVLMDSSAIAEFEAGKRELSVGYDCELDWTPGKTADGAEYDASQRNIRFNHIALVDRARGGPELKLGDDRRKEEQEMSELRKVIVDGITYSMSDQGAELVAKLQKQIADGDAALTAATKRATDAEAASTASGEQVKAKDAEIAALKKQLSDSASPEALQKAAKAAGELRDTAKKIAPAVVLDGKSDAEIRKAVVDSQLGDAAKDFTDSQYEAAFATFAAGVAKTAGADFRSALGDASHRTAASARDEAIAKRDQALTDGWKTPIGTTMQ